MKNQVKICCNHALGPDEIKVLNLLYLPLIKPLGLALYNLLYSLSFGQKNELDLGLIKTVLNIKEKQFQDAKSSLEALGLLQTWQKEDSFKFIVKPPSSAANFLIDTFLGRFLLSEVDQTYYQILANNFVVAPKAVEGYQEITKNFADVYQFTDFSYQDDNEYVHKSGTNGIRFEYDFDHNAFIRSLPNRLQHPRNFSPKILESLGHISYIYNLTMPELIEVFEAASDENNLVNINLLNTKANYYFTRNLNKNISVQKVSDSKHKKTLDEIASLDPQTVLSNKNWSNETAATLPSALSTIYELKQKHKLEPAYLNILIIFILQTKKNLEGVVDHLLPNAKYLEKVLESWAKRGILTAQDAFDFWMEFKKHNGAKRKPANTKKLDPMAESYFADIEKEWLDG